MSEIPDRPICEDCQLVYDDGYFGPVTECPVDGCPIALRSLTAQSDHMKTFHPEVIEARLREAGLAPWNVTPTLHQSAVERRGVGTPVTGSTGMVPISHDSIENAKRILDPWCRRYSVKVPAELTIEVDVNAPPGNGDAVQYMVDELLKEMRRNPRGWQQSFKRMFPELVDIKVTGTPGKPTDVGLGVAATE